MIPPEFIQSLLARVDIVDVVERHLPLKRAGANFSACCPFHNEKTPSFTVSQTKQFYHCFGCGAHGTAISFLMEYAGLSFVEAVKELAGQVGMIVPESQPRARAEPAAAGAVSVEAIRDVLRAAMHFYRGELKKSERAIAYLKQRGLSGEVAAKFALGYAPDGWQNLTPEFSDYQSDLLLQSGLVIDSPAENGRPARRYDRFRDRIMFPILDAKGNVIGFGGRVLGEGEPKYLNSPETPVFEKGRELYGLVQARRAIRDSSSVIVVEGYMDVVALAQHGVENVVATLGTATTGNHVQKLLRQADHVIFSFDGDRSGRAAAWRALENCLPELADKKRISFLFLPKEHDPDSFVREFGRNSFEEKLRDAVPLSEFFLRELKAGASLRSQEGRAQLLENAKPLVQRIRAPIFNLQIRKRLAEEVGVTQVELEREYGARPGAARQAILGRTARRAPSLARRLLKCLLAEPSLALDPALSAPDEPSLEGDAAPAVIGSVRAAPANASTASLLYALSGSPHENLLVEIQGEILAEWGESYDVQAEFQKVMADMAERERERKIDALLKKSEREGWSEQDKTLYRQLTALKA
jgi:DNA primase